MGEFPTALHLPAAFTMQIKRQEKIQLWKQLHRRKNEKTHGSDGPGRPSTCASPSSYAVCCVPFLSRAALAGSQS
ncbi:unnamed protein product [Urochloa humidicola]